MLSARICDASILANSVASEIRRRSLLLEDATILHGLDGQFAPANDAVFADLARRCRKIQYYMRLHHCVTLSMCEHDCDVGFEEDGG